MNKDKSPKTIDTRRAALAALEDFKKEEAARQKGRETRKAEAEQKKKIWPICQWIVLIVCMGIILFQSPKLISAVKQKKQPLRNGTYATDERTDQCITNLWKISAMLQQRKMNIDVISDPASKKPYKVTHTEDDVIVRTPHPEIYGFREIQVRKNNPVPELIE